MGTPKKPLKKVTAVKDADVRKLDDDDDDLPEKKKVVDEDEEFEIPLDDLGKYENFEDYDDDEDDF